jgi:methyl-CpG-binding domain protein 4
MHKVIWDLFELCPHPEACLTTETEKIGTIIRSLGLQNKRAKMLQRFSEEYAHGDWNNVSQLHGIGE